MIQFNYPETIVILRMAHMGTAYVGNIMNGKLDALLAYPLFWAYWLTQTPRKIIPRFE